MADPKYSGVEVEQAPTLVYSGEEVELAPTLVYSGVEIETVFIPSTGKKATGWNPAQGFKQQPAWGWDRAQGK